MSSRAGCGRLVLALVIAAISIFSYLRTREFNPVTQETQYVDLSPEQEIVLGLQAAPEMAAQHGGLHPDREAQALLDSIGRRLVAGTAAAQTPYRFDFHLLADERSVNAFALPGGQVFMTAALLQRLATEGQVAAVLGHEIGHVVARHGAEHMAKAKLTQGLTGAAVLATVDAEGRGRGSAALIAMIGNLVNLRYGREDEIESDRLGVRFMAEVGYDPRSAVAVMQVLQEAGAGGQQAEFFSTHPNPERRVERIHEAIAALYPAGLPEGLEP